jgi:hypothetical protein
VLESAGVLGVLAVAFLATLAILWFFLPFAIFGIQPKIKEALAELKRGNDLLFEIRADIKRLADEATGHASTVATVTCKNCHKEHSDITPTCPFCGFRR